MNKFDFKEWLQNCAFSHQEAAEALGVPVSLVEHYIVTQTSIPVFRITKAENVFKERKKKLEEAAKAKASNKNNTELSYKELLNELQLCLNLEAEKQGGGVFWKTQAQESITKFQSALEVADIVGFRVKSLKIQTNFDDNKFQPHEKVQSRLMPVVYAISFVCRPHEPFTQESFSAFLSCQPHFKSLKRQLADKGIEYVYDYDINNILRKVFA